MCYITYVHGVPVTLSFAVANNVIVNILVHLVDISKPMSRLPVLSLIVSVFLSAMCEDDLFPYNFTNTEAYHTFRYLTIWIKKFHLILA